MPFNPCPYKFMVQRIKCVCQAHICPMSVDIKKSSYTSTVLCVLWPLCLVPCCVWRFCLCQVVPGLSAWCHALLGLTAWCHAMPLSLVPCRAVPLHQVTCCAMPLVECQHLALISSSLKTFPLSTVIVPILSSWCTLTVTSGDHLEMTPAFIVL